MDVTSSERTHTKKIRSMAKADALIVARQTMLPLLILQGLKTSQKASSWMDEIQNLQFQSPISEVEDYEISNSSWPSPKRAHLSKIEAESSKTIVTPAIMAGSASLGEGMANMKAIIEKLTRESEEKEARIKFQEEKIAKLTKNLEKWSS